MNNIKALFVVVVSVVVIGGLFYGYSSKTNEEEVRPETISLNKNYVIEPVKIPEEIYFAGEKIPVHNFDVYESLDREMLVNTYWQSQTLIFIKRAHRFFPIIESILKAQGVPEDFKYLALAESGLANVVSPSNARGYWQFLKGTALDYKLEVNEEVDERYHIEKSTEAAAKYIKQSYNKFGSWAMAAAAYNTGNRSLSRYVAKQKSTNYFDLVLGIETGRYVYRLIALKLILESPEKYGFIIDDNDKYQQIAYNEVIVDTAITNLANFANYLGINYKVLKELNPWLRNGKLTNKYNKTYTIKIASKESREIVIDTAFFSPKSHH